MRTKTPVTAKTLDDAVDFDSPFRVVGDGTIERAEHVFAPEVIHVENEHEPEISGSGWEFVDGYSGQYGYSGPVMHASEFLGGRMAEDVLDQPGVYVVCSVEVLDDPENPAGWALLRRNEPRPTLPDTGARARFVDAFLAPEREEP